MSCKGTGLRRIGLLVVDDDVERGGEAVTAAIAGGSIGSRFHSAQYSILQAIGLQSLSLQLIHGGV